MSKNVKNLRKSPDSDVEEEETIEEKSFDLDGAEEEQLEDEDMVEKSTRTTRLEALLEKAVDAIDVLAKRQESLEAKLGAMKKKEVPPVDDVTMETDVDHDPTEDEAPVEVSPEAATKPAKPTMDTGDAMTPVAKARLGRVIDQLVEKRVAAATKDIIAKASTPAPYATIDGNGMDVFAFIRKSVEVDREACGGPYSGSQTFGISSGKGNDFARESVARFMTKSYQGRMI